MTKRRGNQEGTLYQRESGHWLAQVSLQGRRLSKSFPTQKDARLWIKKILEQIDTGLSLSGARLTVGEYLASWLQNAKSSIQTKTYDQYEGIVRNHLKPTLGMVRLSELQPSQIQGLYGRLSENGHNARTVQVVHSVLRRSLVIAQRQGLIGRNPALVVQPPKYAKGEMQVLTDTQARQLLVAAMGMRNEALYHLAVTTGMRQSELLGLKWMDIQWAWGHIQIQRQLYRVPGQGLVFSPPRPPRAAARSRGVRRCWKCCTPTASASSTNA